MGKKSNFTLPLPAIPPSQHRSVLIEITSAQDISHGGGDERVGMCSSSRPFSLLLAGPVSVLLHTKCWRNWHSTDAWGSWNKGKGIKISCSQHGPERLRKSSELRFCPQKWGRGVEYASNIPHLSVCSPKFWFLLCLTPNAGGISLVRHQREQEVEFPK